MEHGSAEPTSALSSQSRKTLQESAATFRRREVHTVCEPISALCTHKVILGQPHPDHTTQQTLPPLAPGPNLFIKRRTERQKIELEEKKSCCTVPVPALVKRRRKTRLARSSWPKASLFELLFEEKLSSFNV